LDSREIEGVGEWAARMGESQFGLRVNRGLEDIGGGVVGGGIYVEMAYFRYGVRKLLLAMLIFSLTVARLFLLSSLSTILSMALSLHIFSVTFSNTFCFSFLSCSISLFMSIPSNLVCSRI
jgi:hypothetical protein